MLETAIIGGGVSGLALASSLHKRGLGFTLFDGRGRLGGRVLTVTSEKSGLPIDLGPTWFWPDTQPLVAALVASLGLASFPQYDEGAVLSVRDPDEKPQRVESQVHGGARRLAGGVGSFVAALAESLPAENLRLGFRLTGLADRGDHVELAFRAGEIVRKFQARRVVVALPPRLVEQNVSFDPPLDSALGEAMRETGTWMAAQAKVVIAYDRAVWREAGLSGNAFAGHEQAVIGEIYDACDDAGDGVPAKAALGGFLAFSPELRQSFAVGLSILMESQMAQIFGPEVGEGELHFQDWAEEPLTCSDLDRASPRPEHPGVGNPLLRQAAFDGKLFFGGAETASHGAGYLEGALDSARRIERELVAGAEAGRRTAHSILDPQAGGDGVAVNAARLAQFADWVAAQNASAFENYRARLNKGLAGQEKIQLTQRAFLESVEEAFSKALARLEDTDFDMGGVGVERGRCALTPAVQAPFEGFLQKLMDDVVVFNSGSCALSNFPDEHRLSGEYKQTILRDVAAAWREFSLAVNTLLRARQEASRRDPPARETMMEVRP